MVGAKLCRINWSKGEPLERLTQFLTQAVKDWDAKSGSILETSKAMTLKDTFQLRKVCCVITRVLSAPISVNRRCEWLAGWRLGQGHKILICVKS